MNSLQHGQDTSVTEVTNISQFGLWLLCSSGKELFLSYDDLPWFKDQPVKALLNVEEQRKAHFFWPELDVDPSESIIENPAHYPLKAAHG